MELPETLLDLVSNTLILDHVTPHLDLWSTLRLAATSRAFRAFVQHTPRIFRRVDLSRCRGAYIPPTLARVDSGGNSCRAQRMDEHLTEDDIYAGPLRGALSQLSRVVPLTAVHVLVLDGLASVTCDLVSELAMDARYDVRILSVVGCINLNPRKLQQLLRYICRPTRPAGTPKLKGLYYFGAGRKLDKTGSASSQILSVTGVTSAGGGWVGVPVQSEDSDPWYAPSGRIISEGYAQRSPWEETLHVCKGIIAFDAVLCTHMHQDMAPSRIQASEDYLRETNPTISPLGAVALGPGGCAGCGESPRDAPVWGQSSVMEFPLLSPPPPSGLLIDAVRPPPLKPDPQTGKLPEQRLIVSCSWCIANRHCENCHRWWCGRCYDPRAVARSKSFADATSSLYTTPDEETRKASRGNSIKVFNGLCVEHCLAGEMAAGEMAAGTGSDGVWG